VAGGSALSTPEQPEVTTIDIDGDGIPDIVQLKTNGTTVLANVDTLRRLIKYVIGCLAGVVAWLIV